MQKVLTYQHPRSNGRQCRSAQYKLWECLRALDAKRLRMCQWLAGTQGAVWSIVLAILISAAYVTTPTV